MNLQCRYINEITSTVSLEAYADKKTHTNELKLRNLGIPDLTKSLADSAVAGFEGRWKSYKEFSKIIGDDTDPDVALTKANYLI
jgi:hypothetical protein